MKRVRSLSVFLAVVLLVSLFAGVMPAVAVNAYEPTETVTYKGVTFGRATEAYNEETKNAYTGQVVKSVYKGIPLFDGQEAHLDIYVDLLFSEMGKTGIIAAASGGAATGSYQNTAGETVTYSVPTSVRGSADVGNDGGTQWPNQLGVAQSWNKALTEEMGAQYGAEIRSEAATTTISGASNVSAHVAQIDPHLNPLSGRYDEGYGEDAYMISMLTDAWGQGMRGDRSVLYYQSIAHTKHWGTYNSEFFRMQGGNNVSARSFYEYYAAAVNRPVMNGALLGYMSSYGTINGVPSTSSFMQSYIQSIAPNGLASGCDFMSEYGYTPSAAWMTGANYANGYDTFYSTSFYDRNALMILAGHRQGGNAMMAGMIDKDGTMGINANQTEVLTTDVDNGVLGLTLEDVTATVRPGLIEVVRTGALDERDADGQPKYYPFTNASAGTDYHMQKAIQDVALQAAQESIVLLKNNNAALPLSNGAKLDVYGTFADIYQYGLYSAALPEIVTDETLPTYSQQYGAGLTVAEALGCAAAFKSGVDTSGKIEENNTYDAARKVITLQLGGKYVTSDEDGVITLENAVSDGAYFEIEDWGQDAYSFYSVKSGKWLDADMGNPSNAANFVLNSTTLGATYAANFKAISHGQIIDSNFPDFFELKAAGEGDNYYIKVGSKFNVTDFGANFAVPDLMGWYLKLKDGNVAVDCDADLTEKGTLVNTAPVAEANGMGEDYQFTITEVAGQNEITTVGDAAIIVVGVVYNGISGEGVDRLYLNLGEGMAEQAQALAAAYKAAGKKTILIIKADAPIEAESFQNDSNIDAILFMPMGGQYEGYAMAQTLYGEVTPSGKTVSTWYQSQAQLPAISKYSLPILATATTDGNGGNPAYKFTGDPNNAVAGFTKVSLADVAVVSDMTSADLQDNRLTYAYFKGDVTYPFGYGLSYTRFQYSNMTAPATASDAAPFTVTVDVKNTGSVVGAEAVQVYISKSDSAYGDAAPIKRLVAFEKVELAAGETKTVRLTVDPDDLAIWDVNAGKYIVENGSYTIYVSDSSDLESANAASKNIAISGDTVQTLSANNTVNVWSHSYNSDNVKYVEYSKAQTIAAAAADEVNDETFAVLSKGAGAYVALPKVNLSGVSSVTAQVASIGAANVIELRLDSPTGTKIGELSYAATAAVTAPRDSNNVELAGSYTELGYTGTSAAVSASGVHDVYLVFKNADSRIATICFNVASPAGPSGPAKPAEPADKAPSYVEGVGDGKFDPSGKMTRAAVAAILYRLYDGEITGVKTFTDVTAGAWYYEAVTKLAAAGVIDGYKDGSFKPNEPITRAEFAALIARFKKLDENAAACKFGDVSETHWARGAIGALTAKGWVGGYEDNSFRPSNNLTRAEGVKILNAMLSRTATDAEIAAALSGLLRFSDVPETHWAYKEILLAANEYPLG